MGDGAGHLQLGGAAEGSREEAGQLAVGCQGEGEGHCTTGDTNRPETPPPIYFFVKPNLTNILEQGFFIASSY